MISPDIDGLREDNKIYIREEKSIAFKIEVWRKTDCLTLKPGREFQLPAQTYFEGDTDDLEVKYPKYFCDKFQVMQLKFRDRVNEIYGGCGWDGWGKGLKEKVT